MSKIQIPLSQGKFALIDSEDFERVSKHRWCYFKSKTNRTGYACARTKKIKGRSKTILMHRFLLDITERYTFVDHIDRDGLNNCRSNLRKATPQQNVRNRISSIGTSKFKGVHLDRRNGKWIAKITIFDGRAQHIGCFKEEVDAAKAYNEAAKKHFGEFIHLNAV